jgi:hypothetical protein
MYLSTAMSWQNEEMGLHTRLEESFFVLSAVVQIHGSRKYGYVPPTSLYFYYLVFNTVQQTFTFSVVQKFLRCKTTLE